MLLLYIIHVVINLVDRLDCKLGLPQRKKQPLLQGINKRAHKQTDQNKTKQNKERERERETETETETETEYYNSSRT